MRAARPALRPPDADMNAWHRIAIASVLSVIVVTAWLGRYELVGAGEGVGVYRLDRWTGTVWVFTAGWAKEVKLEPEPPK